MNDDTKVYKELFQEKTGIKTISFKQQSGSMKQYIKVIIKGNEEEYENIFKNKYVLCGIKIKFIDFNYHTGKNRITLDIDKNELKKFVKNEIKLIHSALGI